MKQNQNTGLIDFDTPLSESVLNLTTLSPLIDILFHQSGGRTCPETVLEELNMNIDFTSDEKIIDELHNVCQNHRNFFSLSLSIHGKNLVHLLAEKGYTQSLLFLSSENEFMSTRDQLGKNIAHYAAESLQFYTLKALYHKNDVWFEQRDNKNQTPLNTLNKALMDRGLSTSEAELFIRILLNLVPREEYKKIIDNHPSIFIKNIGASSSLMCLLAGLGRSETLCLINSIDTKLFDVNNSFKENILYHAASHKRITTLIQLHRIKPNLFKSNNDFSLSTLCKALKPCHFNGDNNRNQIEALIAIGHSLDFDFIHQWVAHAGESAYGYIKKSTPKYLTVRNSLNELPIDYLIGLDKRSLSILFDPMPSIFHESDTSAVNEQKILNDLISTLSRYNKDLRNYKQLSGVCHRILVMATTFHCNKVAHYFISRNASVQNNPNILMHVTRSNNLALLSYFIKNHPRTFLRQFTNDNCIIDFFIKSNSTKHLAFLINYAYYHKSNEILDYITSKLSIPYLNNEQGTQRNLAYIAAINNFYPALFYFAQHHASLLYQNIITNKQPLDFLRGNKRTAFFCKLLLIALTNDNQSLISYIFEKFSRELMLARNPQGNNLVHIIAYQNKHSIESKLVKFLAPLYSKVNSVGVSPIQYLLKQNHQNNNNLVEVLYQAACQGKINIFKELHDDLEKFMRLSLHNGNTLVHIAALHQQTELLDYFLKFHPSTFFISNTEYNTPIHCLAYNSSTIKWQQYAKIIPNVLELENAKGQTPLEIFTLRNNRVTLLTDSKKRKSASMDKKNTHPFSYNNLTKRQRNSQATQVEPSITSTPSV